MKGKKIIEVLKKTGSLKVTTWCMVLILIVVFWGTLYQAGNGLYASQEKFFHSWFFTLFGFIPFPGILTLSLALFINLILSMVFKMRIGVANAGNLIAHAGIAFLLTGSFLSFINSEHTRLEIKEGDSSNRSFHLREWELAIQNRTENELETYAVDFNALDIGRILEFPEAGLSIEVEKKLSKAEILKNGGAGRFQIVNSSSSDVPGLVISVIPESGKTYKRAVLGERKNPFYHLHSGQNPEIRLRRKTAIIPATILLKDFVTQYHPNSGIPKSYISKVEVKLPEGESYDAEISMNKPFRYKGYTFFQSSFLRTPNGEEYSVIAVVKNTGRLIPYIAGLIIFLGISLHFIIRASIKRRDDE